MILRSHPQLLLLEGELLRVEKIVSPNLCAAIEVFGITPRNELESIGTFGLAYELNVPCDSKYLCIFWQYSTSIADDGRKPLPLITVITNGTIPVSC